jgi:hypothetical protein
MTTHTPATPALGGEVQRIDADLNRLVANRVGAVRNAEQGARRAR